MLVQLGYSCTGLCGGDCGGGCSGLTFHRAGCAYGHLFALAPRTADQALVELLVLLSVVLDVLVVEVVVPSHCCEIWKR